MKQTIVTIPADELIEIQKCLNELRGSQNVIELIDYLNIVNDSIKQYWNEKAIQLSIYLENKKRQIACKYNPDPNTYSKCEFLFKQESLKFYE